MGFRIRDSERGRLNVQSGIALQVFECFKTAGISIAYPQREVRHFVELPPGVSPGTRAPKPTS